MANQSSIAVGTVVRGRIQAEGDLEVLGQVEGSIATKGALEIGQGALCKSELRARRVVVRGAVAGDVHAEETLVLEPGARVVGNLSAPTVGIRPGALVRGHVQTGRSAGPAAAAARADAPAKRPAERPAVATRPAAVATREAAKVSAKAAPERQPAPRAAAVEPRAAAAPKPRAAVAPAADARKPPAPVLPRASSQAQRRGSGGKAEPSAAPAPVVPALGRRTSKASRRSGGR
jgi:cytoskeletal protein CcmA (bactofilin family)